MPKYSENFDFFSVRRVGGGVKHVEKMIPSGFWKSEFVVCSRFDPDACPCPCCVLCRKTFVEAPASNAPWTGSSLVCVCCVEINFLIFLRLVSLRNGQVRVCRCDSSFTMVLSVRAGSEVDPGASVAPPRAKARPSSPSSWRTPKRNPPTHACECVCVCVCVRVCARVCARASEEENCVVNKVMFVFQRGIALSKETLLWQPTLHVHEVESILFRSSALKCSGGTRASVYFCPARVT